MRLGSALDQNEQLDNELVGHLARQALLKSPATSPRRSQTAIEVTFSFLSVYVFCRAAAPPASLRRLSVVGRLARGYLASK